MNKCPVCENDTFLVHHLSDGRLLVCKVCGEDTFDDGYDYEEDEEC